METETGSAIGIEGGVIEGPGVHPLGAPPTLTTPPPPLLPARALDTGTEEEEGNIPALPHPHLFLHLRRHRPHHLPKPATPYLQDRQLLRIRLVVAVLGGGVIVLVMEGVEVELEGAHRHRRPRGKEEVEGEGQNNSLASTSIPTFNLRGRETVVKLMMVNK